MPPWHPQATELHTFCPVPGPYKWGTLPFPEAPAVLLASIEADVYPRYAPAKSNLIDGAIGELSAFHQTFGYYAHGVDETTATLPAGWSERLVPICNENTGGATGWCLDVHDLAASKLVASCWMGIRLRSSPSGP